MTRTVKTARQRAEETLGVAQRRFDRLLKDVRRREAELDEARADLDEAKARLTYAQQDPALTTTPSTTTTPGGTTA